MTMRLSTSSLAGMARTLVAVGMDRLAAMLAAVRAAAPRSRTSVPPVCGSGGAAAGAGCAGAWPADGCGATGPGADGADGADGAGAVPRRGGLGARRGGPGRPGQGARAAGGGVGRLRLIVSEEVPPRPVHRAGIRLVSLVELVHEPLIGPEVGAAGAGRPPGLPAPSGSCVPVRSATCTLRSAEPRGDPEDTADIALFRSWNFLSIAPQSRLPAIHRCKRQQDRV